MTGRVPSVTCFHTNCWSEVQKVNKEIRQVWSLYQPELPPEEARIYKERAAKKAMLIQKTKASKDEILKRYAWTMEDMARECPLLAEESNGDQWRKHLELYDPGDVIWMGDVEDTGSPIHAASWRPVKQWQYLPEPDGAFTCPSVFKRGIWSRANVNIVSTPYLVLEADAVLGVCETDEQKYLNKQASGAIFRWLREAVGLEIKQVVDSGNKSLHAWCKMPTLDVVEELKIILPELGIDRASFKSVQPMRCPGGKREKADGTTVSQRVLWRSY